MVAVVTTTLFFVVVLACFNSLGKALYVDYTDFVAPDPLEGDWPYCDIDYPGATAYNVTDGIRVRCFLTILPQTIPQSEYPLPVMMLFHGKNGRANECLDIADLNGITMVQLANDYGFIIICMDSTKYNLTSDATGLSRPGGLWDIPFAQNDTMGPMCGDSDSMDIPYMHNVFGRISECPEIYDTSRITMYGCSAGASATYYAATCMHENYPGHTVAFTTHSTGLKIQGDGIGMPEPIPGMGFEECATCQYYPAVPIPAPDLKACVFDNEEDPNEGEAYYYESSLQLAEYWEKFGNPTESNWGHGGHCEVNDFLAIIECLDDGVGNIKTRERSTSTTTTLPCSDYPPEDYEPELSDSAACAQLVTEDHCNAGWVEGYCCKTCHECDPACEVTNLDNSVTVAADFFPTCAADLHAPTTSTQVGGGSNQISSETDDTDADRSKNVSNADQSDTNGDDFANLGGSTNWDGDIPDPGDCGFDGDGLWCDAWPYFVMMGPVVLVLIIVLMVVVCKARENGATVKHLAKTYVRDSKQLSHRRRDKSVIQM
jgi:hypothetical protein